MIKRTILPTIEKILHEWNKMVFISGPRQVGKTTLAHQLEKQFPQTTLFNWDVITDRKRFTKDPYFFLHETKNPKEPSLLLFDELHKYNRWKSYLKGVYDQFRDDYRIAVTGSGRLDLYKKGGESLLGRYFGVPLFPLSMGELSEKMPMWKQVSEQLESCLPASKQKEEQFQHLMKFSGFPEPYLRAEDTFCRMWSEGRNQRLIQEDIRDASYLRNLSQVEMLANLLPTRVGSLLSINSLREDLETAFETVKLWIEVLSQFYYLFRVPPYTKNLARSIKKEPKIYLYDWTTIDDEAARFENVVALHLLKSTTTWQAFGEAKMELYFIRDKEKREVDFLITEKQKPILLVECKTADTQLSPHLLYFQERLEVPIAVQLLLRPGYAKEWHYHGKKQWVVSAERWLPMFV